MNDETFFAILAIIGAKREETKHIENALAMGIYMIINMVTNRVYIGQTSRSFLMRWSDHLDQVVKILEWRRDPNHDIKSEHNYYLYNSMITHGVENFKFVVVETVTKFQLNNDSSILGRLETQYIKLRNSLAPNGYNLNGGGGDYTIISEPTRNLLSRRAKENSPHAALLVGTPRYIRHRMIRGLRGVAIMDHPLCNYRVFSLATYKTIEECLQAACSYMIELEEIGIEYIPAKKGDGLPQNVIVKRTRGFMFQRKYPGDIRMCAVSFEDKNLDSEILLDAALEFLKRVDADDKKIWLEIVDQWKIDHPIPQPEIPNSQSRPRKNKTTEIAEPDEDNDTTEETTDEANFDESTEPMTDTSTSTNSTASTSTNSTASTSTNSTASTSTNSTASTSSKKTADYHHPIIEKLKFECYKRILWSRKTGKLPDEMVLVQREQVGKYIYVYRTGPIKGAVILNHPLIKFAIYPAVTKIQVKVGEKVINKGKPNQRIENDVKWVDKEITVEETIQLALAAIENQEKLNQILKVSETKKGLPMHVSFLKRSFEVRKVVFKKSREYIKVFDGVNPDNLEAAVEWAVDLYNEGSDAHTEMMKKHKDSVEQKAAEAAATLTIPVAEEALNQVIVET